jgi:hyperosmotically inducible periplasmic protein
MVCLRRWKVNLGLIIAFVGVKPLFGADKEVSTFKAYVDSDLCARLMLGPITSARVECSQKTHKEGSPPVLVRLSNNMILDANKDKMIKDLVGQLADVSGELNVKNAEVKLQAVNPIQASSIPPGDPARKLLDVRTYRTQGAPKTYEKIRHELAMLPYISEFDFISFAMVGNDVILSGWTVRQTNRSDAQNIVKNIEGVGTIINNIDVLPLGSMDMRIRAGARAVLQRNLARYFWGSGSDIKIIVKNGDVILLGAVTNSGDKDIAGIRINSLPGVFHVFNLLQVQKG